MQSSTKEATDKKNNQMLKRVITGCVGAVILIIVFFVSNTLVLNFAMALVSILSLYEMFVITKYIKHIELMVLSFVFAAAVPFLASTTTKVLMFLIFLLVFALFSMLVLNQNRYKLEQIGTIFLLSIIIPFFFSNIVFVRRLENGEVYFWLIFLGAWLNDIFALFSGMLFGKHKLAPTISPKKTIEGAIGGLIGTVLGFVVFTFVAKLIWNVDFIIWKMIILAVACVIAGVIGDLSASVIKRQFQAKDFGTLMPGHGGVMDRFDSILFVAPLVYCVLNFTSLIK